MRTTLASGAWVEHTPIQEMKGVHRRKLDRVGKPRISGDAVDGGGNVDVGALLAGVNFSSFGAAKRDGLWALLIEKWSYDLPVPCLEEADGELVAAGVDAFDEIPLDDYDEIEALFAPFSAKLNRRPDPKGTTTTGSSTSSRASTAPGSPTA